MSARSQHSPSLQPGTEQKTANVGDVSNSHEKRSFVWTCATAKYNLRLLMMRSDQPTRETGTSLKLSESSSSSCNVPHPLNRQVIRLVGQRQEVAWWQDEEMCRFSRESEHVVTSPTNRLILCPLDISPRSILACPDSPDHCLAILLTRLELKGAK